MENKDLGSKKINNKQETNEGFSGKNMFDSEAPKLKEEIETDAQGNEKKVHRACNIENDTPNIPDEIDKELQEKKGLNRGVSTEEDTKKTVENRDRNSDITPNRYPNSNPDNHIDRGNQKLDE